jgi:hypothetical protein
LGSDAGFFLERVLEAVLMDEIPGRIGGEDKTPWPIVRLVQSAYGWVSQFVRGNVLDAGCGFGYGSMLLIGGRDINFVTGIDLLKPEDVLCPIPYVTQDLCQGILSYSESMRWDWIVCLYVLEHLAFEEQGRVVKTLLGATEGLVLATNVIGANQFQIGAEIFVGNKQPDHKGEHTPETWMDLVGPLGGNVVGQRFMGGNGYRFHSGSSVKDVAQLAVWWPLGRSDSLLGYLGDW